MRTMLPPVLTTFTALLIFQVLTKARAVYYVPRVPAIPVLLAPAQAGWRGDKHLPQLRWSYHYQET